MDFITDLPVSNGYDSIFTVVDRHSKSVILLPCHKTITTELVLPQFGSVRFFRSGSGFGEVLNPNRTERRWARVVVDKTDNMYVQHADYIR